MEFCLKFFIAFHFWNSQFNPSQKHVMNSSNITWYSERNTTDPPSNTATPHGLLEVSNIRLTMERRYAIPAPARGKIVRTPVQISPFTTIELVHHAAARTPVRPLAPTKPAVVPQREAAPDSRTSDCVLMDQTSRDIRRGKVLSLAQLPLPALFR